MFLPASALMLNSNSQGPSAISWVNVDMPISPFMLLRTRAAAAASTRFLFSPLTIASGCQSHAVSMCINVCLLCSLLSHFEFLQLFQSGSGQIKEAHTCTHTQDLNLAHSQIQSRFQHICIPQSSSCTSLMVLLTFSLFLNR